MCERRGVARFNTRRAAAHRPDRRRRRSAYFMSLCQSLSLQVVYTYNTCEALFLHILYFGAWLFQGFFFIHARFSQMEKRLLYLIHARRVLWGRTLSEFCINCPPYIRYILTDDSYICVSWTYNIVFFPARFDAFSRYQITIDKEFLVKLYIQYNMTKLIGE